MKTASIAAVLLMSSMTSASLAAPSSTTRTVVLEKIDTGAYRCKITRASVPEVGDRQVLVRVRAVALNRLASMMCHWSSRCLAPSSSGSEVTSTTGKARCSTFAFGSYPWPLA